jgi:hypothetical protein
VAEPSLWHWRVCNHARVPRNGAKEA